MRVLSVGAVLWDLFDDRELIGGAPFNFAANLRRLGAESALLTAVGTDGRGARTETRMREIGIDLCFLQRSPRLPTGTARVVLDERRNASYEIPYAAFDEIAADDATVAAIRAYAPEVICFGTLEQRSEATRAALRRVLDEVSARHVFYDVNLRMDFCDRDVIEYGLERTSILKLNEEECALLARLFFGETLNEEAFARRVAAKFGIETVIVTLGGEGCYVRSGDKGFYVASKPASGGDTVGAGDAFSAAFVYATLLGRDAKTAACCGTLLGGYVAGRAGALPVWDETLQTEFAKLLTGRGSDS